MEDNVGPAGLLKSSSTGEKATPPVAISNYQQAFIVLALVSSHICHFLDHSL